MSRLHIAAISALLLLALPASAVAQVFQSGAPGPSNRSTVGRVGDAENCQGAAGGSRVRANCDPKEPTTPVPTETALTEAAERAAQLNGLQCEATTLTEYLQRNTVAHVDGRISVSNCATGTAGTFIVVVRVKDESGGDTRIEFNEDWQRDDAQDVSFLADYPIGEDVELVSVRVRDLRCTCADAAQQEPTVDQSLAEQ